MKSFEYVIRDNIGIHARPAGMLVKKVAAFQSAVTIYNGGKSADACRLFAVMGLSTKHGDTITVQVEGPDEEAAVAELEAFVKENL